MATSPPSPSRAAGGAALVLQSSLSCVPPRRISVGRVDGVLELERIGLPLMFARR
jgi:hypothetical protein